jgi:hypothetical protein
MSRAINRKITDINRKLTDLQIASSDWIVASAHKITGVLIDQYKLSRIKIMPTQSK